MSGQSSFVIELRYYGYVIVVIKGIGGGIMRKIINSDKDFMKRKKFFCIKCNKRYSYNKLELIDKGNKCERCGGELAASDLKTY